jgi:hypothetical protein
MIPARSAEDATEAAMLVFGNRMRDAEVVSVEEQKMEKYN